MTTYAELPQDIQDRHAGSQATMGGTVGVPTVEEYTAGESVTILDVVRYSMKSTDGGSTWSGTVSLTDSSIPCLKFFPTYVS